MNKKPKIVITVLLVICIAFFPMATFAHGGGKDSNDGHHDYKNKSGLGPYHYHCGGAKAHLHPNGVCPYGNNTKILSATIITPVTKTTNSKTAVITASTVKINGNVVSNSTLKYPLISYNNITYFPLTYRNKVSLGISSETKDGMLYFTTGNNSSYTADIIGSNTPNKKISASVVDYGVYINGTAYFYDISWPLLKYNDIVYVPMTYSFAQALDLSISWSQETGLSVSSKNASAPAGTQSATQATQPKPVQAKPIQQTATKTALNKNSTYVVYGLDGQGKILGEISSNFNSPFSIFNKTDGIYAEKTLDTSIWNPLGVYGKANSTYSATNPNAAYPPAILDENGNFVAILSANTNLSTEQHPTYTVAEVIKIFAK
ncbi:MAG: hypothetical protein J6K99_07080 [Peptococcaceae bacterium]|nr:hypothetical protein [Peptococcaceae bacterium]